MKVDLLRLMLPTGHTPVEKPVWCAWKLPDGTWQFCTDMTVAEIAATVRPRRVEICPHPADIAMTQAELPPLPPKKLRAAAQGVVELLCLGVTDTLSIGFGARATDGKTPIAWADRAQLDRAIQALARHGLRVNAILPPPAFLPLQNADIATSINANTIVATVLDGWIIARTAVADGCLIPAPGSDIAQCQARLQAALSEGLQSNSTHWIDISPSAQNAQTASSHSVFPQSQETLTAIEQSPSRQSNSDTDLPSDPFPWSGADWPWTLPLPNKTSTSLSRQPWHRPAMAWGILTLSIWLAGLHLYAQQIESQGQALKRDMAAQVKAAFPEVSVVLNPLQQARQLRDARLGLNGTVMADDFSTLARSAATLLTQANAQVERVRYQQGELHIDWREGAIPNASDRQALQTQAEQRGLAAQFNNGSLRLQVQSLEPGT